MWKVIFVLNNVWSTLVFTNTEIIDLKINEAEFALSEIENSRPRGIWNHTKKNIK